MFSCVFFNCWFSADAIRAKLITNPLKTFQKSRKDLSSANLVGCLSPRMAYFVCDTSSMRLELLLEPT